MIVKCKFVSVWDDATEIMTDAELDTETGEIMNIETKDVEDIEVLTDEYILAEPVWNEIEQEWNGIYIKVCQDCHDHVIGFMGMWDDELTGDYIEHYGCPECNDDGDTLHQDWYDYAKRNAIY